MCFLILVLLEFLSCKGEDLIKERFSIVFSGFLVSVLYYLITSILPIYLVESSYNGGLSWTRAEAFSLFGTYVALSCISPFLGGLLADFFCGRRCVAWMGYALVLAGVLPLSMCRGLGALTGALAAIALGSGFLKVCLMSSIGLLSEDMSEGERHRFYDRYYMAVSFGYVVGHVCSNTVFSLFRMGGVVALSIVILITSARFAIRYLSNGVRQAGERDHVELRKGTIFLLLPGLILLGMMFFLASHQSHTSLSLFIHQEVDRSFFGLTIPTLWFPALGSFSMMFFVPLRRQLWKALDSTGQITECLKITVGFLLSAVGFSLFFSLTFPNSPLHHMHAGALVFANAIFFLADAHVRPVLFSAATRYVPRRYHTLSTALVYVSIGLGGKLAGVLAGGVDTVGFAAVFTRCMVLCSFCALCSLILSRWVRSREEQLAF